MRLFPQNRTVVEQGAVAIHNFCRCFPDAERLALAEAAGCAEALLQAVLAHPGSVGVQSSGLYALANMVASRTDAGPVGAATGTAALAALRAHPEDTDVAKVACRALAGVTFFEPLTGGVAAAGGVGTLIAVMQEHPDDLDVQGSCCLALNNIAWHLRGAAATAAEARSCIECVATALSAHADSLEVVDAACNALESLLLCTGVPRIGGEHLLSVAPGIAEALAGFLPRLEDAETLSSAARVLAWLCECPGGQDKVAAAEAAAAGKAAAARYPDDEKLREAAAALEAAIWRIPQRA